MNSADIVNLFKGVGVIIDNSFLNAAKKEDRIWKIKSYFEKQGFPLLTYSELPTIEEIKHFYGISFILLDWNLSDTPIGLPLPDAAVNDNIDFIESIRKHCFAHIFIFTNEETDSVINILESKNLYRREVKTNHIFVRNKNYLKNRNTLFSEIAKWVNRTPSIYILKTWENALAKGISEIFYDLCNISPSWPYIMCRNYYEDIGGENSEIFELLNRNLEARCMPLNYDDKIVSKKRTGVTKDELRKLLECERFIPDQSLRDYPAMGDVFKRNSKYFINIRPDCDILRVENPILYCIEGNVVKEEKINVKNSRYEFKHGAFRDRIDFAVVPFIDNGKIIEFKFKDLKQEYWQEVKSMRVGRLLPPYITRLKLQYIAYLQRQAIPSIPENAIK